MDMAFLVRIHLWFIGFNLCSNKELKLKSVECDLPATLPCDPFRIRLHFYKERDMCGELYIISLFQQRPLLLEKPFQYLPHGSDYLDLCYGLQLSAACRNY